MTTENTQPTAPVAKEGMPQYKLKTDAYLGDRYRREGESIYYKGRPEWYMEPVNEAAKKQCEKHKAYLDGYTDPIQGMTIVSKAAVDAQKA